MAGVKGMKRGVRKDKPKAANVVPLRDMIAVAKPTRAQEVAELLRVLRYNGVHEFEDGALKVKLTYWEEYEVDTAGQQTGPARPVNPGAQQAAQRASGPIEPPSAVEHTRLPIEDVLYGAR